LSNVFLINYDIELVIIYKGCLGYYNCDFQKLGLICILNVSVKAAIWPLKQKISTIFQFDSGRLDATLLKLTKIVNFYIHDLTS